MDLGAAASTLFTMRWEPGHPDRCPKVGRKRGGEDEENLSTKKQSHLFFTIADLFM